MPDIMDNDPVKLRELAKELKSTGGYLSKMMDDIQSELQTVMRKCEDDRISDFRRDFQNTARELNDFHEYLGKTSAHLEERAKRIEETQNF